MQAKNRQIMQKKLILFFVTLLTSMGVKAQNYQCLSLPNQEQLSSNQVLFLMEDGEGYLWYATEGGGVCRDDGRQVDVFRSDAKHPDLLGSNNVSCLAEASGRYIIIGTFHGAYVLDKRDYSIHRIMEVDDKRVDDIIVTANGHWWMTANKKIYDFSPTGKLLGSYPVSDKFVSRLFEDKHGHIWFTEWNGGLWRLPLPNDIVAYPVNLWTLEAAPSVIVGIPHSDDLWIGTIGKGIVRYHADDGSFSLEPETSNEVCIDMLLEADGLHLWLNTPSGLQCYAVDGQSLKRVLLEDASIESVSSFHCLSRDHQGRLLVANSNGACFAIDPTHQRSWFSGQVFTKNVADSVRTTRNLSTRPTALAISKTGELWFSTGKDIRQMKETEEIVPLPDTKDVSAMTFSIDGSLWLGTIFGQLYRYKDGKLMADDYASNEYGDGITALSTDTMGRLVIVHDRYVRLYDTTRHTLRQQSREADGVYCIELQETAPNSRWSQPERDVIVERMPHWLTSWWMWCVYVFIIVSIVLLAIYSYVLRRQRNRFLAMMKTSAKETTDESVEEPSLLQSEIDPFLQKAIEQIEKNLDNNQYSVEEIGRDLCISRMTFYRKIQSLTGQSPTEFIRTIRLRRAAEMLREGRLSVTEVSFAAGFSSVSYFSRCFRTMYGVPPTQFIGLRNFTPDNSVKKVHVSTQSSG